MQVLWREFVNQELTIGLPCNSQVAVAIGVCLQVVLDADRFVVKVDTCERRCRFGIVDGCFTAVEHGAVRVSLGLEPVFRNRVLVDLRIVARACIDTGGAEQHWILLAKDIIFFRLDDQRPELQPILALLSEQGHSAASALAADAIPVATLTCPLTEAEIERVLTGPVTDPGEV